MKTNILIIAITILLALCWPVPAICQQSFFYIEGNYNRDFIQRTDKPEYEVIARFGSGYIITGLKTDHARLVNCDLRVTCLGTMDETCLYRLKSDGAVDPEALRSLGRILIQRGNDVLIAANVVIPIERLIIAPGITLSPISLKGLPFRPTPLLSTGQIQYDPVIAAMVSSIDTTSIQNRILALQSLGTRYYLSSNRFTIADTIRQWFTSMGIPLVEFDTLYTAEYDSIGSNLSINVIATIPGSKDTSVIYISGGHYDSYTGIYTPAPGADDNGTGLAATLEMARIMALFPPRKTVRFIAFAAEEVGALGSIHYAGVADSLGMDIGCVLVNDVMGYVGNNGEIQIYRYPGFEAYGELLGQTAQIYTTLIPQFIPGYYSSDDYPFFERGYPATRGKEYPYSPYWHTMQDIIDYVSIPYCSQLTGAGLAMIATLTNYPGIVQNPVVSDLGDGERLQIAWEELNEPEIHGYNIYYGYASGSYAYSKYTTSLCDTISGLTSNVNCYITVRAVDNDGRESPIAAEAIGVPVLLTLDKGILVVDETQNWTAGSFPRDTTQDKYYRDLLDGYIITEHEYGTSGEKPGLIDLAPYSTVFWHADDYSSPMLNNCVSDLKLYLSHGGKLCVAGWKPSADIIGNNIDTAHYYAGSFMYDYMKVSQMSRSLMTDSFQAAVGKQGYSDISVDPAKVPVASWIGTMRYIEKLTPVSPAEGIYDIDMKNNGSSFEGQNCGVRYLGSDFQTALLGFPLYFMDQAQAKAAVQKIMDDFGEVNGVYGKPETENRITAMHLFQNAPNPFNKQTSIKYQLPKAGRVRLNIYNIAGQLVKTLVNKDQPAGSYTLSWDRKDNHNKQVSAGVYIYYLSTGDKSQSRKMIVLK
ncbi:MAG: M28 family peptidase [Candidatus Edwardsbacteria bacterium]|nr:M28 family peptidase [Candidatus Edwardsbacteria bacterium]MBU1576607.1 M28 family peptidase [Candidatus Edwardsbacteria bacterium]MBU2594950.1 M28 family peptidase [Candidatus Edwardsbacteria bacterium]